MKILTKTLYIGFVFQLLNAYLFGARFDFPAGTPGLQADIVLPPNNLNFKHIFILNTNCHLYFPVDGSQPDTADAGLWSGARNTGHPNDDEITDWWVRVFGGNNAVNLSRVGVHDALAAPQMGVYAAGATHIIQVDNTGAPAEFERQFWQTFRMIAADPVGRVLLYRLLIEIRRKDNADRDGCCGDDAFVLKEEQENFYRKNALSLAVINSNEGCSFVLPTETEASKIKFSLRKHQTQVLNFTNNILKVVAKDRFLDIGLFHEMIHWFHFLRDPERFANYDFKKSKNSFRYPLSCYYGNLSELHYIWQGECNADSEEIATVLGVPNPYDETMFAMMLPDSFLSEECFDNNSSKRKIVIRKNIYLAKHNTFLQGDDLSENVYRKSKGCDLHFSHSSRTFMPIYCKNKEGFPYRFKLAKKIASHVLTLIKNN